MEHSDSLGFGIVGCGMIADFHGQAIQAMQGGHLECVYSRNLENAERMAERYGCKAYTELDKFLEHSGLDVVTIATPSGAHLEPCLAAARAKKHVLCEKPLEVTLERIDEMIAACQENGVTLSGIFPRRFNDAVTEFKKAVSEGRLGQITSGDANIKWWRDQAYYDNGAWRGTWELDGGGALMNQGIHTIDMLIHLAGEVESVCAFADRTAHEGIEVEDIATAIVRFKNGALGTITASTSCYNPDGNPAEVQVCGTDGSIFLKDDKFSTWVFRDAQPSDSEILAKHGEVSGATGVGAADPTAIDFLGHQRNFEDAVNAIRKGEEPAVNGVEARKSIEVILAIYQSALNNGARVELPLAQSPQTKSFR